MKKSYWGRFHWGTAMGLLVVFGLISTGCERQRPVTGPVPGGPDRPAVQNGYTVDIDMDRLAEQSRATNRPVYILFSADWCGYCKVFEQETLAQRRVREALNDEVIYVKVDADQERSLLQQYNVRGLPTGILLQADNRQLREVDRHVGAVQPEEFLRFLRRSPER